MTTILSPYVFKHSMHCCTGTPLSAAAAAVQRRQKISDTKTKKRRKKSRIRRKAKNVKKTWANWGWWWKTYQQQRKTCDFLSLVLLSCKEKQEKHCNLPLEREKKRENLFIPHDANFAPWFNFPPSLFLFYSPSSQHISIHFPSLLVAFKKSQRQLKQQQQQQWQYKTLA